MAIEIRQRQGIALNLVTSIDPIPFGDEGGVVSGSYYTLTTETTTLASGWNEWLFSTASPLGGAGVSIVNNTPSVCSIANFPRIERIVSGVAEVSLEYRGISTKHRLDMRTSGASSSTAVTGFVEGSLGDYSLGIIQPLLDAGGGLNLLDGGVATGDNLNFSDGTYNPTCWAADFDFTGVSHNNSEWGTPHHAGTLITRRHVLMSAHYTVPVGTVMTFISADGTKHQRAVIGYNAGSASGTNSNGVVGDIAVATLSSNLHESITSYPLVGDWIRTDITVSGRDSYLCGWIGVKLDQRRNVNLAGRVLTRPTASAYCSGVYAGETFDHLFSWYQTDFNGQLPVFLSDYSDYSSQNIVGDSGSPRFIPLSPSLLALAGCVTSADGGGHFPDESLLNACIASADADAIARGNLVSPTGLTVTVAPDPTL